MVKWVYVILLILGIELLIAGQGEGWLHWMGAIMVGIWGFWTWDLIMAKRVLDGLSEPGEGG